MNNVIPYQEVKLESQTVNEIVEDIGILKKIEEASKFEIGRRLVYLKENCTHGEYLPKLEEVGISRYLANEYINFFTRFANVQNFEHLGVGKMRELLRIPKGKEEEYLNKISDPNEATAKQLRKEIDRLKQEKEQEKLAKDVLIKNNQQLQEQLEKEKKTKKVEVKVEEREVEVVPDDYNEIKSKYNDIKNALNTKDNLIKTLQEDLKNNQLNAQQLKNKNSQLENELREIEGLKKEKDKLLLLYGDLTGKTKDVEEVSDILFKIQKMTSEILRLKAYTSIFEDDSEFVIKNPCKIKALEIINTGLDLLTELKEEIEPRNGAIDVNKNDFVEVNYEF